MHGLWFRLYMICGLMLWPVAAGADAPCGWLDRETWGRSHANAAPHLPMSKQYACGSNADRSRVQNEIACVLLDGSNKDLIVAPVMTNLDTAGEQTDYGKTPKGNLDITGQYFI